MPALSLFHIAIKTARPEATRRFYAEVFGMSEAPRPAFEFPGFWMQLDMPYGGAIFHIYTGSAALGQGGHVPTGSGAIDHVALAAQGFTAMRARCRALGLPYREREVPGFPLWQLFCYDPNGIQFEMNFHSAHERAGGVQVAPDNWVKAGSEWFEPASYERFGTT
jgi:catechol 2,3-dioxygenase-like lactoylglutathione lyase family enzyme